MEQPVAVPRAVAAGHERRAALAVFGSAIALSAFLLFSVQPIVGRVTLPVFGGAPGVWATSLFFFQFVLLLGYLYGHLNVTRLGIRRGAVVHLGIATIAVVVLLAAPQQIGHLRSEGLAEVANLLDILVVLIGPAAADR